MAKRRWIVETDERANHEVGGEPDEPGVFLVTGRARLAGDRPVQHLELLGGAALDYPFHDGNGLVGGQGVDDLGPIVDKLGLSLTGPLPRGALFASAWVVPPDGTTITILDAIDQRRLHLLAAIRDRAV